jgi:hypothetical protein
MTSSELYLTISFPAIATTCFPKKDRIIDFMNLNFEKELESKIIEKTQWYPLDNIELG